MNRHNVIGYLIFAAFVIAGFLYARTDRNQLRNHLNSRITRHAAVDHQLLLEICRRQNRVQLRLRLPLTNCRKALDPH